MAQFTVSFIETMTHTQTVEAETWEEAVTLAEEKGVPGLCNYCTNDWQPDEAVTSYQVQDENDTIVAQAELPSWGPLEPVAAD